MSSDLEQLSLDPDDSGLGLDFDSLEDSGISIFDIESDEVADCLSQITDVCKSRSTRRKIVRDTVALVSDFVGGEYCSERVLDRVRDSGPELFLDAFRELLDRLGDLSPPSGDDPDRLDAEGGPADVVPGGAAGNPVHANADGHDVGRQEEPVDPRLRAACHEVIESLNRCYSVVRSYHHQVVANSIRKYEDSLKESESTAYVAWKNWHELEKTAGAFVKRSDVLKRQVEDLEDEIELLVQKRLFEQQASKFRESSVQYQRSAKLWLLVSLLMASVLVAALWVLFVVFPPVESLVQWAGIVPRTATTAFLLLVVGWSARQYRVRRHLDIANEAKANAIDSLPHLLQLAQDRETSADAILAEVAKYTFDGIPTGLVGSSSAAQGEPNNALSAVAQVLQAQLKK